MINATGLELRAGSRIPARRSQPPGPAGRPRSAWSAATAPGKTTQPQGAGRRGAARTPARSTPLGHRSATCRRIPRTGRPRGHSPATGCCPPAVWTSSVRPRSQGRSRQLWPSDPSDKAHRAATAASRTSSLGMGGYAAETEAATICRQPRPARPGAGPAARTPCPAASAAASNWPASCSPTPGAGGGTLLLDEPTNHLDADSIIWLRDFLTAYGRPGRHQPRRRRCSTRWSTRSGPPRRQPRRRSTSTTWAGRRTCTSARPTSGAASGSAPTPRRRPARCMAQADKMRAKATKAVAAQNMDQARRAAALRASRTSGRPTGSPSCASPTPRRAARPRSPRRACRSRTGRFEIFTDVDLAIDRGIPGGHPRPQRRRQDHAAADAGRRRPARHRRGDAGPRAASSATTRRSTRRSTCERTVLENMRSAAPDLTDTEAAQDAGRVPVHR